MAHGAREWLHVRLDVPLDPLPAELREPDEIAGLLFASLLPLGCLGVSLPVAQPGEAPAPPASLILDAFLPRACDAASVVALLSGVGLGDVRLLLAEGLADPGWVERFNESLQPIDVGRRFTILPRGGEPGAGRLGLHVETGRAFGTGHHESTRLALAWLDDTVLPGDRVLDVGTGSGILAFGAARLGAALALGRDVDPEAIEVATENVVRLPERDAVRLEVGGGAWPDPGTWDVVVANITIDVILPMLDELVAALKSEGTLILAGLLVQDASAIDAALAKGGRVSEWRREGEWVSARVRRT